MLKKIEHPCKIELSDLPQPSIPKRPEDGEDVAVRQQDGTIQIQTVASLEQAEQAM